MQYLHVFKIKIHLIGNIIQFTVYIDILMKVPIIMELIHMTVSQYADDLILIIGFRYMVMFLCYRAYIQTISILSIKSKGGISYMKR